MTTPPVDAGRVLAGLLLGAGAPHGLPLTIGGAEPSAPGQRSGCTVYWLSPAIEITLFDSRRTPAAAWARPGHPARAPAAGGSGLALKELGASCYELPGGGPENAPGRAPWSWTPPSGPYLIAGGVFPLQDLAWGFPGEITPAPAAKAEPHFLARRPVVATWPVRHPAR